MRCQYIKSIREALFRVDEYLIMDTLKQKQQKALMYENKMDYFNLKGEFYEQKGYSALI